MNLQKSYSREEFLKFLEFFIPHFKKDVRIVNNNNLEVTKEAFYLGESDELDLSVFELTHTASSKARVSLATDGFRIMKHSAIFRALVIYKSGEGSDWRLSLMTTTPDVDSKGKVKVEFSNPRRYSFFLGVNAKVNTPYQFLIKQGPIKSFEDLKSRFSIEVVNREFYKKISECFTDLVGGSLCNGNKQIKYNALLKLPYIQDKSQTCLEFAVRLMGRVIFCWFLREKKSDQGISLMPNELLSLDAVKQIPDYYHKILEPIFFEVLNKPVRSRRDELGNKPFSFIPYLNGGLFSPHGDDFFSYDEGKQSINHNLVVVPDNWLMRFFEVLEIYNFTIDENTSFDEELSIDPEMLGRIFENLLAEINPETGESARKSTGSYYTPRSIVDYMVDESLLLYLQNQAQIGEDKLRAVISYDLNDDAEYPINDSEKQLIIDALEKVKILDPACGSGAFPMGALQKIVFILQRVDPAGKLWFRKQVKNTSPEIKRVIEREFAHKNFDYIRKLGIIRENIYGVDIQPIATEISRLRCFLTLVVDERVQDDTENRGIEPLPNLDFKFVTSNTLISLPESKSGNQMGLFEDEAGIKELKELRDMFFNASGSERDQLKLQFVQAQNRMFQRLIHGNSQAFTDLTTKLTTWDPFSHKSASWFDSEWMFGVKVEFDIVISNPPYIQIQSWSGKPEQKLLEAQNYETFTKTGDIYCLFYERGYKLLKTGGVLTFITSNKWMRAKYGEKLRTFFSEKTQPLILIDFGGYRVFESATVDTNIIQLQNPDDKKNKKLLTACRIEDDFKSSTDLRNYIQRKAIPMDNLSSDSWIILSIEEYAIKKRIEEVGTPLREWDISINYGIKTGLNEAFIIDGKKKNELIAKDAKSAEIIKPILRGRDIKRYKADFANLWLISTFPALNIKIDEFPAVKEYLQSFGRQLEQSGEPGCRKKTNNKWFEVQDTIAYYKELESEKIVYPDIMRLPKSAISFDEYPYFFLDKKGYFAEATTFLITGDGLYLIIAVLSSKFGVYAFTRFYTGPQFDEKGFRYKKEYLQNLPIPKLTEQAQFPFEILVNSILFAKENNLSQEASTLEWVIDTMVYGLYFEAEMKKDHCYINDRISEVIEPFKPDDTDEVKAESVKTFSSFCRQDKIVYHGLVHSRNVKPVKIINEANQKGD